MPEPVAEKPDQPDTPPQPTPATLRQRLGAIVVKAKAHPVMAVLVAAGGLAVITGVVAFGLMRASQHTGSAEDPSWAALEALDQGDWDTAKQIAESVVADADRSESSGIAEFVLGRVAFRQADKATGARREALFLLAARYLESALARSLPDDRLGEAQFMLGKSLYEAGRTAASRSVLRGAIKTDTRWAGDARFLLAATLLHDPAPQPAEALEQNRQYLAQDGLSPAQQYQGMLQQAEILLALGKPESCLALLARIPRDTKQHAAACVLRGRALLAEAQAMKAGGNSAEQQRRRDEKLQAAMTALRDAVGFDALRSQTTPQATYLIGLCLAESGDLRGALHQLESLRQTDPSSPEYLAGAFQEAVLQQTLGQQADSVAALGRALRAIRSADQYRNPWLPLEQLRSKVLELYQQCLESRDFASAVEVARHAASALAIDRAVQMQAEAYQAWGHQVLAQSEHLPPTRAETLAREGRSHLRRAAQLWRQAANLRRATRRFPEDLWQSATCALEAHDYRQAAKGFEEYLKEQPRGRQAQAWTGLGESLLSSDRIDDALTALNQCVALYPRDAAAARARLLAAVALQEKGEVEKAQRLLEENLNGEVLTPASREYRDSLLALGRLLYQTQRYEEAIRRLDEVVRRYGGSGAAIEASFLIADGCYRIAQSETAKLPNDVVALTRSARTRRIRDHLASALQWYRQAQQALLNKQEASELGPVEKLMLRNSYFSIGSVLFDLGQYDAAIKAYASAAARCQDAPEALEAYLQMARAYRAMNQPAEAHNSILHAKALLARLKDQAPWEQTTLYSRAQWAAVLESNSTE